MSLAVQVFRTPARRTLHELRRPASDDVEDIGRPDLEVLRASEAKNCDLLIEIGGRMDEVCESCHKVF